MIVGIFGIGVVGHAVYKSFLAKNIKTVPYDKYKNIGDLDKVVKTDMVFLCLPTPFNESMKSYDKTFINEVCSHLSEIKYSNPVILKSTVEPGVCEDLAAKYNLQIIHNPEFLSAKTAFEDFHSQKHIILGSTKKVAKIGLESVRKLFEDNYGQAKDVKISLVTATESESAKLFVNNFYSVKIQFFNELYLLCKKLDIDYDNVKNLMLKNGWINPMHTQVPGTDGKLSFGGMCFPKDTEALLAFMNSVKTPHAVLEATVNERKKIRKD